MSVPFKHVTESWQSAEFYANKVLRQHRTSAPEQVEWVKLLKDAVQVMLICAGTQACKISESVTIAMCADGSGTAWPMSVVRLCAHQHQDDPSFCLLIIQHANVQQNLKFVQQKLHLPRQAVIRLGKWRQALPPSFPDENTATEMAGAAGIGSVCSAEPQGRPCLGCRWHSCVRVSGIWRQQRCAFSLSHGMSRSGCPCPAGMCQYHCDELPLLLRSPAFCCS